MRKRVLFSVVLLAGVSAAAHADDWNKQFTVSGKPDVVAEVQDGNLRVTTGPAGQVRAAVITRGWRIGDDEVRVTERQTGNRVEIEVRVPRTFFGFGEHGVRVELTVPRESNLSLHTKDGNVVVDGVKGEQRISTGDGNVEGRSLEGSLTANTGDGNVRLDGRFDLLSVNTGDGNVDVEVGNGSRMNSSWTLRSGDGNVSLRLPEGFAADLDAQSGDGRVSSDLPVTVSGSMRENEVRGKMNGGGQLLQIRTGDGTIRVSRW